jgi:hypothetical protein
MKQFLTAIPSTFLILFALTVGNVQAHDDAHNGAGHGAEAAGEHAMEKMDGHKEEGSRYKEKMEGMTEKKYGEYKKHEGTADHLKEEGSGTSDMMKKEAEPMRKKAEGSMN